MFLNPDTRSYLAEMPQRDKAWKLVWGAWGVWGAVLSLRINGLRTCGYSHSHYLIPATHTEPHSSQLETVRQQGRSARWQGLPQGAMDILCPRAEPDGVSEPGAVPCVQLWRCDVQTAQGDEAQHHTQVKQCRTMSLGTITLRATYRRPHGIAFSS